MKALFFSAPWCGQCKVFKPQFEAKAKENNIEYSIVDVEDQEDIANKYSVRNIPTIVLLDDNGEEIKRGLASEIIVKLGNE